MDPVGPTRPPLLSALPDEPGGLAGKPAEIAPYHPALTLRTCGVMPAKEALEPMPAARSAAPAATASDLPPGGAVFADVARTFPARRRRPAVAALRGVSLAVGSREVVAVVGPSGCGKSPLLELACGLQAPDAGRIDAAPAVLMPQRDLLL